MSDFTAVLVKPKHYLDSVALMRSSSSLSALTGVVEAAMMMGTPSNIEILHNAGLIDSQNCDATPTDLIIAVRGLDEASAKNAMYEAEQLLNTPRSAQQGASWKPKSMRSALQARPSLNLALISVPGAFAISEARKAVHRGLHVMIFSDNVPVEQEAELKQEARKLGKLIMGPDCGTAIINGVPLAFANKVPRGDIALVGASGTGIQEITCLLASYGQGISQAIGVGGRDLHESVGGISTLMALEALENDQHTKHIVLVSKPPSASIVEQVLQAVANSKKSVTLCFLGGTKPTLPPNCNWAETLSQAAALAAGRPVISDAPDIPDSVERQPGKRIHGLFCGGTLCTESLILFKQLGVAVSSNVTIPGMFFENGGHQLIDLGADEFTQGKPHPMIEPAIRDTAIRDALTDSAIGVLLVDMVIGYGSHPDPAGQFIAGLESAKAAANLNVQIVASVTGTDADPQGRTAQVAKLEQAGVLVAISNEQATRIALSLVSET